MGIIHSEKSNMVDQTAARNECVTNLESLIYRGERAVQLDNTGEMKTIKVV